ncbi:uncharacterized protein LOC124887089 [Capsicum annuum]|uniref:uncharacterized protein LOC124887089 n=1 Tax=Capsicum annuum TaxID=4072 RepID=UPI001FB16DF2|nr:uncharacterized protein LOC124887089 [Capsicum annuum]
MKLYHEKKIEKRIFKLGDLVLLYNLRFCFFPSKLKLRWTGPFTVVKVFPYGAIEVKRDGDVPFKVNQQRVKHYMENLKEVRVYAEIDLGDPQLQLDLRDHGLAEEFSPREKLEMHMADPNFDKKT